jgi:short-subunit dehydrogenase
MGERIVLLILLEIGKREVFLKLSNYRRMSDKYSFLECLLFPYTRLNKDKLSVKLKQRTVLITGASYGIGEALAYKLAENDVYLILTGRTASKLHLIKETIIGKGGKVDIFPADLRNSEELEGLISFLKERNGGIDIFVNNAGKSIRRTIENSLDRYHDFTRTMAINYNAPVQLTLSLIPILKENQGHIINISAINVLLNPVPKWAAYQASKVAFDHWFRCVVPELNARRVATTTIYLPLVKTRMIEPTEAYRNMPAMKPEHVARIICKSIITHKRVYKPWWLIFGEFTSFIFRPLWEVLLTTQMKKEQRVSDRKEII